MIAYKHLSLFPHSLRGFFLPVGRIALLAQNTLNDDAQVRPNIFPHCPVDGQGLL